jgi:hypothetical protein
VNAQSVVGLAAEYSVPTIYVWREYVLAGGLKSYGTDPESYHQGAVYAGHSERREARKFTGCAANEISRGGQCQGRQIAWY